MNFLRVHILEDQVEIAVIVCRVHVEQSDDVGVIAKGFEKDDFSEGPLRIGLVAKCIKDFLDGDLNEVEEWKIAALSRSFIVTTRSDFLLRAFHTMP